MGGSFSPDVKPEASLNGPRKRVSSKDDHRCGERCWSYSYNLDGKDGDEGEAYISFFSYD